MEKVHDSDLIRLKILEMAKLDFFKVNLETKEVLIGDIIANYFDLANNVMQFDEFCNYLNNEGKDLLKVYTPHIKEGIKDFIILPLSDREYPKQSVFIQIANVDLCKGYVYGYMHIIPRGYKVSNEIAFHYEDIESN